jgi:hypothetical protein
MDAPLRLDDVRQAVGDLTAALTEHRSLTEHQWDHAITTLHIAREQHGGRIRYLIHVILSAGGPDPARAAHALPDALSELHCHLAVADEPPPPPAPRDPRRRRPAPPIAHTQLELFASPPERHHDDDDDEGVQ